jgi:AcrR family transcriptional regulator
MSVTTLRRAKSDSHGTRSIGPRRKSTEESWQRRKSELTRTQILEAAMDCLAKVGYAQTTTERIAKQAKVSRGAMTHHFKSRFAVFEAVAKYIADKRISEYDSILGEMESEIEAGLPTLRDMHQTMVMLHKYYAMPSFTALIELSRGARAEKRLMRVMEPLEKAIDERSSESIVRRFPFWKNIPQTRIVLTDLVHFTLQGVALDPATYVVGGRLNRLFDLLASIALREFEQAYNVTVRKRAPG